MTFRMRVNNGFLYLAPDGREAWVIFVPSKGVAYVVTDIEGKGQPHNAIAFSSETLRAMADQLDEMTAGHDAAPPPSQS